MTCGPPGRPRRPHAHAPGRGTGFTLLELLVTIAVLGTLTAVVVFAAHGAAPRARAASCSQDESTLATAEEAYNARHGSYTTMSGLVAARLIESPSALHSVQVAGSGYTLAAATPGGACWVPPATMTLASAGWSTNGPAVLASALTLTPRSGTARTAGSAWIGPIPSGSVTVAFDLTVRSGNGVTLAFTDPSAGTAAVGANQAGRGFGGLPGTAVVIGTRRFAGDPGANFMGVATGWVHGRFEYAETVTRGLSRLTTETHHIVAHVAGGRLTVTYDGAAVLDTAAPLPPNVLVGFTGSSAGHRNVQQISNVVIST